MKKIFVAAALALTLVLSACGGQGGKSDTTEVTFLTHWGPDQVQMLEAAAAAYTAINPDVTVKIQAVPFGNLLSTLRTQGSSADGPTIVGIYDAWLPELVRDGLAAKAPADVAAMVKANWPGGLVAAASQGGDVYGVPNEMALYALNYNQALFDQAGIAEPPKTWDETVDAALKISALGADIQGIGFITNWTAGAIHPFLSLLASNGGTFLNADGLTAALDSAAALETA
ncbi:MAG: extracellular solute-binding protein, partial [Propionibacteriaceae bacterium]|nr:extracellular solute-binding protein [Propionibacteriaceae bacterium]